jgi:hypothetical protein
MTDKDQSSTSNTSSTSGQDELTVLKGRADTLGISYHPSIGLDKLREKVIAAMEGKAPTPELTGVSEASKYAAAATPRAVVAAPETDNEKRVRLKRQATMLVRVRVTCMNPAKKEWDGEIFTAGNASIGSVKKYVPFNADDGWHVPNIILQVMQDRQCQVFITAVDSRGNKVRRGKLIKEFAIEVMPQLTTEELEELAARQAATKSID